MADHYGDDAPGPHALTHTRHGDAQRHRAQQEGSSSAPTRPHVTGWRLPSGLVIAPHVEQRGQQHHSGPHVHQWCGPRVEYVRGITSATSITRGGTAWQAVHAGNCVSGPVCVQRRGACPGRAARGRQLLRKVKTWGRRELLLCRGLS